MNKGAVVGAIVLLVIIIAGAYLILQNQVNLGSNANLAVISLTDPPNVPNGTTSLMISYSAVQAHVVNASSSGWVNIQGSGSVDLLSLVNVCSYHAAWHADIRSYPVYCYIGRIHLEPYHVYC